MNNPARTIWENKRTILKKIGAVLGVMLLAIASYAIYDGLIKAPAEANDEYADSGDYDCSVMGINLHGTLMTYIPPHTDENPLLDTDVSASEEITYYIQEANDDDDIKAIVLEIDSPGGYPVAGEEVAAALKQSKKPTVAMIRQQGLSAAYWAATGAQHIFASKNSDVGSIGVTMSYLDNVGKNQKDGNDYVQLSAGKYKDAGDPDKALTDDEKQVLMRDVNIMHQNFIANVAANRNISVADVQKIADGSSVLGDRAKELHLIDDIGGMPEVESYLQNLIGEKPSVCWQ